MAVVTGKMINALRDEYLSTSARLKQIEEHNKRYIEQLTSKLGEISPSVLQQFLSINSDFQVKSSDILEPDINRLTTDLEYQARYKDLLNRVITKMYEYVESSVRSTEEGVR